MRTRGDGVKKFENFADIISGSSPGSLLDFQGVHQKILSSNDECTKWKRISFYTQPHQTSTTIICRLISKYRGLWCDLDSCVERLQDLDNAFDNFFKKRLVRSVLIGIIKCTQSMHKLISSLSGCLSGKNSSISMAPQVRTM